MQNSKINTFWENFSTACCTESYLPLSLHRRDVARSLGIRSVREPQRDLGTGQNCQHCNVTAKMWPSRPLIPKKNYFKLGHGILHGPVCQIVAYLSFEDGVFSDPVYVELCVIERKNILKRYEATRSMRRAPN